MKKILLILSLYLLVCGSALAKTPFAEFEKAREIRLLQSTREDIKRILKDFEHDADEDDDYTQTFSNKTAEIEVTFAKGDCSEDLELWNVNEWVAVKVIIDFEEDIKVKDFRFDFSNFTKEVEDEEYPEDYFYQNEYLGIVFDVSDNEISRIVLFPPNHFSFSLCENENTEKFSKGEQRLFEIVLESGRIICGNAPPTVDKVTLNTKEIIIGCNKTAENEGCEDSNRRISVESVATDRENDVLTYNYTVSAGEIVGSGAKVVWDLTGVAPGTYTITVGADDGCGICGPTKTETVVVKECADCAKEKPQTVEEKQTSDTEKQMTNTKTQPLTAKTQP